MTASLIGVPCYNGARDLLPSCLGAIRARTGGDYDLVVVDDSGRQGHQEETRRVAERHGARWLCHEVNRGITAAWNTLVRSSDASDVALLNDDIVVEVGWLDALTYFLRENPGCGSVGLGFFFIAREDLPALLVSPTARVAPRHHATKAPLPASDYAGRGEERPGRVMCPPGCAFGFRREKYDLVGGFDPAMRQWFNESDFGTALAARGHPSYVIPHPVLWHVWGATFERAPELLSGGPMERDRAAYRAKWGGDFDVTDPRYMAPLHKRPTEVRWIGPGGLRAEVF